MKMILMVLAFIFAPLEVKAQVQTYVSVTSATYCMVSVSSYTPTRVDNFNGGCEGLMSSRTTLKIVNPTGNATINCGYSSIVSTNSTNSKLGEEFVAGGKGSFDLSSSVQYWCMTQSVAVAAKIQIQQLKPFLILRP